MINSRSSWVTRKKTKEEEEEEEEKEEKEEEKKKEGEEDSRLKTLFMSLETRITFLQPRE